MMTSVSQFAAGLLISIPNPTSAAATAAAAQRDNDRNRSTQWTDATDWCLTIVFHLKLSVLKAARERDRLRERESERARENVETRTKEGES